MQFNKLIATTILHSCNNKINKYYEKKIAHKKQPFPYEQLYCKWQ